MRSSLLLLWALISSTCPIAAHAAEPKARPVAATTRPAAATTKPTPPQNAAELFKTTAVWNVHLTFTPEQWAAMEPKDGGALGPGVGGQGSGPREPFGPAAAVLAAAFL